MIVYPAIDILEGKAVRLLQGDYEAQTVYDADPVDAALRWVSDGAEALHVVDLEGARQGEPASLGVLARIAATVEVPIQYGGGLRTLSAIDAALDAGADRVVLGTAAHRDPQLLDAALASHGDRVAVALDVRGGRVATAGWTESGQQAGGEVIASLQGRGVRTIIYTDVDRDGMLGGPDLDGVCTVAAAVTGGLIYSGGIGSLADLEALAALGLPRLAGVIVGKALYERRFTVAQANAASPSALRP